MCIDVSKEFSSSMRFTFLSAFTYSVMVPLALYACLFIGTLSLRQNLAFSFTIITFERCWSQKVVLLRSNWCRSLRLAAV